MRRDLVTSVVSHTALAGFAVACFLVPGSLTVTMVSAAPSAGAETITLTGTVRDFTSAHADFGITDPAVTGHYVSNVGETLSADGKPVYSGSGREVTAQWIDKDGNRIMPYVPQDGEGLPGGHFDIDVFDELTDKEYEHEHEFDDEHDVTYVDVVNDPNLKFDEVVPLGYPNDLRIEFLNPHHSSGIFTFAAGDTSVTQAARQPFTAVFCRDDLAQCRVDFAWLFELRATSPGDVHDDVIDRDDAFAIRMFDAVTDELVYELAVYHHGNEGSLELPPDFSGEDSCANDIEDTIGSFGDAGGGAVTGGASYDQWFSDVAGTNLSSPHSITLTRDLTGVYEYSTESFYPIDDALYGNGGAAHNYFFTYSISATFTYDACQDWFFEFEGNDDAWVYIDGELVMDVGGVATPYGQYAALDRLDLVDGEEYTLDFFFAHRRASVDSTFRMRTNIPLESSDQVAVTAGFD